MFHVSIELCELGRLEVEVGYVCFVMSLIMRVHFSGMSFEMGVCELVYGCEVNRLVWCERIVHDLLFLKSLSCFCC